MPMPELSPLVAPNLVCRDCGSVLKPKVVFMNRGQKRIVSHLEYECRNEKTGCSYRVESSVMTSMEMKPLRPDGSIAKVGA